MIRVVYLTPSAGADEEGLEAEIPNFIRIASDCCLATIPTVSGLSEPIIGVINPSHEERALTNVFALSEFN